MLNKQFPYYSSNIKSSKVLGFASLGSFIKAHKNPKKKIKDIIDKAQLAAKNGDLKLKNELKSKLYSFTPAVVIAVGKKRRYDNIVGFTGFIQLDFDKIPNKEMALLIKHELFNSYPQIICAYISPSGLGVKCLMRIKIVGCIKEFKLIYNAIEREMEQFSYFDTAVKNAVLPLYLSYDLDILYRENPTVWVEEYDKPVHFQAPVDFVPSTFTSNQEKYFYDKTVRIVTDKINQINDNGHPQLRDAALCLGTRVGAGYIGRNEAESILTNLINSNSYLQKGLSGYIKTGLTRIEIGSRNPQEY